MLFKNVVAIHVSN